jgi:glucokinase
MSLVKATLAIDVGASKIAGALINADFKILHELSIPARQSLYGLADPDLALTKKMITELLEVAKSQGVEVNKGGACFAEYVTPDQLLNSRDQIAWSAQPKQDFTDLTGFSWVIESDVRAMALAEAKASSLKDFLFVTISSGISHALVINGKPWSGATGEAIGFGITQIDNSQESPTLEQYSSGMGIARRYQQVESKDIESAENVFANYNGDKVAKEAIDSAAAVLGKSLAALVDYIDPAKIVIGGGLWLGSELYRNLVLASYEKNVTKRRKAPEVINSISGAKAAVIGAAIAAS